MTVTRSLIACMINFTRYKSYNMMSTEKVMAKNHRVYLRYDTQQNKRLLPSFCDDYWCEISQQKNT